MKLLSVNVSLPKEVLYRDRTVTTSIFKEPVDSGVMLRTLNLDGDGQADLIGHGGIYKAAYAYSIENYDYWKRELARTDFTLGQFGENFTVEEMLEDEIHVGDVFRVGGALVQVTQPRVPCYKLGIKMGLPRFVKTFLASCRVGFYLRVLEEGEVGAGDVFERVGIDPERMTVREICHLLYFDTKDLDGARKALRIRALSPGWRQSFEERLAKTGVSIELREEPQRGEIAVYRKSNPTTIRRS
jgi:MOSC domain-containing protein YiiM